VRRAAQGVWVLAEAQGLWGTGLVGTADGLRGRTARAWRRLDRRSGLCVRVRSAQSVGSLFQLFSFSGVCYACGGVSWMHAHLDGQGTAWEGSWGPQLQASGRRRTARHRCCCSDEPRRRGRRPAAARATRKHMRRSASSVASDKTVPAVAAAARRWHRSAAGAGSTAAVRTGAMCPRPPRGNFSRSSCCEGQCQCQARNPAKTSSRRAAAGEAAAFSRRSGRCWTCRRQSAAARVYRRRPLAAAPAPRPV
jgi:hypothetical protein